MGLSDTSASTVGSRHSGVLCLSIVAFLPNGTNVLSFALGFSLVISTALILLKHFGHPLLMRVLFSRNRSGEKSYWPVLLEWVFVGACFYALMLLEERAQGQVFLLIAIGVLVAASPLTFDFVFRPLLLLLRKNKIGRLSSLEDWAQATFGERLRVRMYEGEVKNAYAVGVIPFSETILIGRPLVEKLSTDALRAAVAHEVGHLRHNDLLVRYLSSVLCTAVIATGFYQIVVKPEYGSLLLYIASLALTGGIMSALCFVGFHKGLVERRSEYAADRFAAKHMSSEKYALALQELDVVMDGSLSKGSVSHPSLEKRLQHIGTRGESSQAERPAT